MKKTILILPYFGEFKVWSSFFFHSVAYLRNIKILLVTDSDPGILNDNVILIRMTFNELKTLISNKLNCKENLETPYKLTDFRPAYGQIFEEHIGDFQYWGHCDEDMIFGDMDYFLNKYIVLDYDVISSQEKHISGHFTIYKNNPLINNLFRLDDIYLNVFTDQNHWGFDEISWFKDQSNSHYESSFTAILKQKEVKQELKIKWGLPIKDDLMFKNESFTWSKGHLYNQSGEEFSYYHWNNLKRGVFFKFPKWHEIPSTYHFNFWGFYLHPNSWYRRIRNYFPTSLPKFIHFLQTRKYY